MLQSGQILFLNKGKEYNLNNMNTQESHKREYGKDRSINVQIRLTSNELEALKNLANNKGVAMSKIIRDFINEAK